jgi:DNA primase (bacterial type)
MVFKDKSTGKFILCLDGDSAGENASRLLFEKNPSIQRNLYITIVPEGKDPCDYLGENKNNRLNTPVLYIEYVFEKFKRKYVEENSSDPYETINEFGKLLTKVPDELLRNSYIQKLSTFTLIPINTINDIIGGVDAHSIQLITDLNSSNMQIELEPGNYFDKALALYVNNRKSIKNLYIEKFPENYQIIIEKIRDMKVVMLDEFDEDNPIITTLINNMNNLKPYSSFEEDYDIQVHYITLIKYGLKELEKKKKENVELLFRKSFENATSKEELINAFAILNK